MESAYRNLAYFLIALPLMLIAGFWTPYFSQAPAFEPSITAAVHLHAFLLFAWVLLLLVQPLATKVGPMDCTATSAKRPTFSCR